MAAKCRLAIILLICLFFLIQVILSSYLIEAASSQDDQKATDEYWKSTAEIVRLRGFIAEDHYVTTTDGYILNIVRCLNPLINNGTSGIAGKNPLLFVHGILVTASYWVTNSVGASPKDYSNQDIGSLSSKSLQDLLLEDPAAKSLALTAVNFGHEVWLLNRRGSPYSLGHVDQESKAFLNIGEDSISNFFNGNLPVALLPIVGNVGSDASTNLGNLTRTVNNVATSLLDTLLKNSTGYLNTITQSLLLPIVPFPTINLTLVESTFNARYWNYSFDEQARYDIPETIDYILLKTKSKQLNLIGHSAGGQLIFQSLAEIPELASKLSKAVALAPSLDVVETNMGVESMKLLYPLFTTASAPFPDFKLSTILQYSLSNFCNTKITLNTICESAFSMFAGPSGYQQNLQAAFLSHFAFPASTHELAQIIASVITGKGHYFDYLNSIRNEIAYGQPSAPIYDVGRITLKGISIWIGKTDTQIPLADGLSITEDLKVPYEFHYLNGSDLFFNHFSFLLHKQIVQLLNIPILQTLYAPNP